MLHKTLIKLNHKNVFKILPVRSSALFINGSKATENFAFIVPHVDFPNIIKNKDMLQTMINKRKSNFDLLKLENLLEVYNDLRNLKLQQENSKLKLSKELSELLKLKNEGNEVEKFKIQISLIKENIKNLKSPLWSAEEAAMVEALNVPNLLHKLTPDHENNVIFQHQSPPRSKKDHNVVGNEKNLIKYIQNTHPSVYLLGDAALFELGVKFYFSDYLKRSNYIQFSNPDFVKSLVVEGCGVDHTDPTSTFILQHNDDTAFNKDKRLHLTGAGSLYSFLAYHAKNVIYSKVLPLKYFSLGRQYTPSTGKEENYSLFNLSQSSAVQIFGVARDNNELDELLHETLCMVRTLFNELDYHYRLSYVAADKIHMWESLRVSIEMYSTSLKKYIEIGHLSLIGDFMSKRLLFTYTDNKEAKFPHVLSGTILNVPKFLGCVLEQDEEFTIPDVFRVENWSNKKI
ncbi:serine--tRNA synthetase-like protein Slimp [Pieris brassicae]|uniref:serine--tRNA synthetase-like protein Slimp n=1 Tax=Pieris brassicae TaxID=7116 RepID=UPI001E65F2F0|nr:serine--tRNA synthetase-like protein Slimp [Pieris brassicae]